MRKANRACTEPGCPAFSCDDDRCIKRKQATHVPVVDADPHDRGKYSRGKAYGTVRWRTVRSAQLSREPLCQRCLSFDLTTIATDVDHVQPHLGNAKVMWDSSNYQSLCHSCHSHKTRHEQ